MEKEEIKAIIESILFAAGKEVNIQEISMALEKPKEEIENIIKEMQEENKNQRGIEIIKMEENYQLVTKKEKTFNFFLSSNLNNKCRAKYVTIPLIIKATK